MTDSAESLSLEEQKAEARRLRRQRQTTKNLVASLVASLGIVVFLVFVVARPDTPVREEVDYLAVAGEVSPEAPAELVVPELDETWSANRADLSEENTTPTWTLGLISSSGDFVQVLQLFGDDADLDPFVSDGKSSTQSLPVSDSQSVEWTMVDRSAARDVGNYAFVAHTDTASGRLVVRGTSEAAVLFIATTIQRNQPHLFATGEK